MPGYVSHTVMARDVYNKINNKKVSLDYMLTYSLGGDLSKYAKCRRDSHHIYQDKFIYNMCDYMKDNNLVNDTECLGVLYGHICHYVMDDVIHPLVRKIDKTCVKNKSNHTMIELYYDSYLVDKRYNLRIDKYDNRKILRARMNKKIRRMIDYAYLVTYNTKHVSWYYIFNKGLYKKIRYLYKIFGINLLKKISGFNKFMEVNKNVDIVNDNHKISYKNYLGYECNDDLMMLYDKCISRSLKYINKVNKYMEIV